MAAASSSAETMSSANVDALITAVRKNAVHTIEAYIKAGKDVNAHNKYGSTPLIEAAQHGRLAAATILLDAGAMPNENDFQGWCALHQAVRSGSPDIVEMLITRGANVNAVQHGDGWTPLLCSVDRNLPDCAAILLAHGAKTNAVIGRGETALHLCMRHVTNSLPLLELLLASDIDVDRRNKAGLTPLHVALDGNKMELVRALVAKGADVNAEIVDKLSDSAEAPIHTAAKAGKVELMTQLIEAGADVNKKTVGFLRTPLHVGLRHPSVVTLLIDRKASINERDNMARTPFISAATFMYWSAHQIDILTALANAGADVNAEDENGHNAMHASVADIFKDRHHIEQILPKMKDLGVDIDKRDNNGLTPIALAVSKDNWYAAEVLMKNGANINILDNVGQTPLIQAVAIPKTRTTTLTLLLDNTENVDTTDGDKNTALHIAAGVANKDAVDLLLQYGANPNAVNAAKETALTLCCKSSNTSGSTFCTRLLLKAGADTNICNDSNTSVAHLAIKSLNSDLLKLLLASQGVANPAGQHTDSPLLHFAIEQASHNEKASCTLVGILVEKGADLGAKNSIGQTALHVALSMNSEMIANKLLTKSICTDSINTTDGNGLIHSAVLYFHPYDEIRLTKSIYMLLERGVDVNLQNNKQKTALHLAVQLKKPKVVEVLLSHKADASLKDEEGKVAKEYAKGDMTKLFR